MVDYGSDVQTLLQIITLIAQDGDIHPNHVMEHILDAIPSYIIL